MSRYIALFFALLAAQGSFWQRIIDNSYFDLEMKKPALYADLAIRGYTYADVRYWFAARGKGIADSNYPICQVS